MSTDLLRYAIIIIIVAGYVVEMILGYLNRSRISEDVPEELKDIYDAKEYQRSQAYKRENDRISFFSHTFSIILILSMLIFGGFAWVDTKLRAFTEHPILLSIGYFFILGFASSLLGLPFQVYNIFVTEEKYGFNKTTPKIFILDKIKSLFLTVLIGGGLMALIIYIYLLNPLHFWLYAWLLVIGFSIFITFFYSTLIVPIFNKQEPLQESELKTLIENFTQKVNFKLKNIFVIDGSKRSTKANAYFTGFGKKKRVVLYDTLIKDISNEEIVAVLAHEIAHYKRRHIFQNMFISIVETGIVFYLFGMIVANPQVAQSVGAEIPSFHINLVVFGILYSPISMVLSVFKNIWSRKNEYEADNFVKNNFDARHLIEALKKISVKALSNLKPHPLYIFIFYSHPTLLQRIKRLSS